MVRSTLLSLSNANVPGRKSILALAGLVLWLAAVQPASAQLIPAGGFLGRGKFKTFNGELKVVDNTKPGYKTLASINVKRLMDTSWGVVRPYLAGKVPEVLREYNIGGGWRTYDTVLNLGSPGPMQVAADGRGFTLKTIIPGNSITVSLRTPTAFGSYADPRFTLDFDLVVTLDVEPTLTSFAVKGGVKLSLQNARLRPGNLVAEIAFTAANLTKAISGVNLVGLAEREINTKARVGETFNREFSKLGAAIRTVAGPNLGLRFLPAVLARPGREYLMISVDRVTPLPVIR